MRGCFCSAVSPVNTTVLTIPGNTNTAQWKVKKKQQQKTAELKKNTDCIPEKYKKHLIFTLGLILLLCSFLKKSKSKVMFAFLLVTGEGERKKNKHCSKFKEGV